MSSLERQCTCGVLARLEHGKEFSAHRLAKAGDTDRPSALPHLFNQSVANQQHFDTYAFHDGLRLISLSRQRVTVHFFVSHAAEITARRALKDPLLIKRGGDECLVWVRATQGCYHQQRGEDGTILSATATKGRA